MKRLFIIILVLAALSPVQGGSNITQRAVSLQERVVLVKFINMGVDAHWGNHILENAAYALPVLEDLIGIPLPQQIESVEIYGKRDLGVEEWAVGYNDGNMVALKTDHPDPTIVFHELVHFWTFHYHIPWPLVEGYCNLYADLCAAHLGLNEVAYPDLDWQQEYEALQKDKGKVPLNTLDYSRPDIPEEQVHYFYWASTVIMYNLYEAAGEENLKAINGKVAEYSLDDKRGGIGIIQYLRAAKEVTNVNYTRFFMPVILTEWEEGDVSAFENGIARYCAVSTLTGVSDTDEQMVLALNALLVGKFSDFDATGQNIVKDFYAKQMQKEKQPVEQEIVYPEKKTGLLYIKLFLVGVATLIVGISLLFFILSKLAKEEEEFEWEEPLPSERPQMWVPPPERKFAEDIEKLPEIPDLEELTK